MVGKDDGMIFQMPKIWLEKIVLESLSGQDTYILTQPFTEFLFLYILREASVAGSFQVMTEHWNMQKSSNWGANL